MSTTDCIKQCTALLDWVADQPSHSKFADIVGSLYNLRTIALELHREQLKIKKKP